jgi:hypothetical protein
VVGDGVGTDEEFFRYLPVTLAGGDGRVKAFPDSIIEG